MGDGVRWFATAAAMTALPDHPALADLPTDVDDVRRAVQGLLVHRDLVTLYGLDPGQARTSEQHLRSIREVLARAFEISPHPITTPREPIDRVVGICRHYALLHTALLRAQGVPARARCGFSNYFDRSKWTDHWITERWDGQRWVRDDPQVDQLQIDLVGIDFDPYDQPAGQFLDGCEAWIATRVGELDPALFGIMDMWGPAYIAGNALTDVASLNKVELLPWDAWGIYRTWGPHDAVPAPAVEVLDDLCALVADGDIDALRERYDGDDRIRVPTEISTIVDGGFGTVTIEL